MFMHSCNMDGSAEAVVFGIKVCTTVCVCVFVCRMDKLLLGSVATHACFTLLVIDYIILCLRRTVCVVA